MYRLVIATLALALLSACERTSPDDAAAASQPNEAPTPRPSVQSRELTCTEPVRASDTMKSLHGRFGAQAREETLGGPEGTEFPGLVLWPDEPSRRLEVFFGDEEPGTVSSVRAGEKSRWRVAGLEIGDPLARVREVHGAPFTFLGFGWDYGGYVGGLADGRLGSLPGGCTPALRLDALGAIDESLEVSGDLEVSSDLAGLEEADIRVTELGMTFRAE